jgi:hypothetical protein
MTRYVEGIKAKMVSQVLHISAPIDHFPILLRTRPSNTGLVCCNPSHSERRG